MTCSRPELLRRILTFPDCGTVVVAPSRQGAAPTLRRLLLPLRPPDPERKSVSSSLASGARETGETEEKRG